MCRSANAKWRFSIARCMLNNASNRIGFKARRDPGPLEPGPRVTRSASMQDEQVKACLEKAAECERRAVLASDDTARQTYRDLASQWRDMARQVVDLERRRPGQPQ